MGIRDVFTFQMVKEVRFALGKGITVVTSGYFDPITPAHLAYFDAAERLGDIHKVILNRDDQLLRKRLGTKLEGRLRYTFAERKLILEHFRCVDEVVECIDDDNSVTETLMQLRPQIFAKGGDRELCNIPQNEIDICNRLGIKVICGVGGGKTHSSSWMDWE